MFYRALPRRGVSLTDYMLVVALVAIVALGAVGAVGSSVECLFASANSALGGNGCGGPSSEPTPTPTAAPTAAPTPTPTPSPTPVPLTYAQTVVAMAPVAYWRLGEASGTVATDASGNGHDAAWNGTPLLGQPSLLVGDADPSATIQNTPSAYLSVPHHADLDPAAGSFSYFQLLRWPTGAVQERWLAGKGNPYGGTAPGWAIANWTTGNPVSSDLYLSDGTVGGLVGSLWTLPRGQVAYVGFTYDAATKTVHGYLDGVLVSTLSVNPAMGSLSNTQPLLVGTANGTGNYSPGDYDEPAIWDRALSAAEIESLYVSGSYAP